MKSDDIDRVGKVLSKAHQKLETLQDSISQNAEILTKLPMELQVKLQDVDLCQQIIMCVNEYLEHMQSESKVTPDLRPVDIANELLGVESKDDGKDEMFIF